MAYREMVLNHSKPNQALEMFKQAGSDPAFIEAVKSRIAEVQQVTQQCFAAKKEHEFLTMALDDLQSQPVVTEAPAIIAVPATDIVTQPQDHEDMTSKLSTLADLAKTTIAQVEADAEAEVNKLMAAKGRANAAVANVGTIRTEIESGAKELEDFANQITNGAPPLDS